jgi:hypothetical protein
MQYCECEAGMREVIRAIPWQHDVCGTCGLPIEGTAQELSAEP